MAAAAAPASSGITTVAQFLGAVLGRLGLPNTAPNREVLLGWAQVEGTKARNNPLATTYTAKGIVSAPLAGNSAGVQEYATPQAGVEATAATLRQYPSIVGALKTGNALQVMFGNPPGLVADFSRWSGNAGNPSAGLAYFQKVKIRAQGSTSGGLSSDVGFFSSVADAAGGAAGAAGDAASAVVSYPAKIATQWVRDLTGWLGQEAPIALLYFVLTLGSLAVLYLGLSRVTRATTGASIGQHARAAAATAAVAGEIPF